MKEIWNYLRLQIRVGKDWRGCNAAYRDVVGRYALETGDEATVLQAFMEK